MKLRHYTAFLFIAFLILGSYDALSITANTPAGSNLALVSSNSREVILELTVADFQIEPVGHAGQTYQHLIISGLEQTVTPGAPQVPVHGAMVGLTSTSGLSVEILEADHETLIGYRLYPAPKLERLEADSLGGFREVFAPDSNIYGAGAFYPGQPVELGQVRMLRDQAAVPVRFFPIQYNPISGEVRFYRRLRVRVSWDDAPGPKPTDPRGASPAYENLLRRLLLNYETLTRPPVVQSSLAPGVTEGAISVAVGPGSVKIGVTEDGMYEVTPADLPAGFDLTGVDIDTLKLKNKDTEIPIYMHDDNGNDAFDGNDYFLFYGVAITDIYTTKNIYWLEADGVNGQRMSTRSAPPGGATVPDEFPATLHAETDSHNEIDLELTQDTWFWGDKFNASGAPESRNYSLTLKNISTTALTAAIRVRLQGWTDPPANPDHHTKIYLNNVEIDSQKWNGRIVFDHKLTAVPHSSLIDGTNTIRVEGVGDMVLDQFYVNWLEIDYWDTYVAENNQLLFGAPNAGPYEFHVSDFTDTDMQLFDITNPYSVVLITDTTVVNDGGSYTVQFQDTAQTNTQYLALTSAARKNPVSIELDVPSSWNDPNNGAGFIIITHEDFYATALNLANHRSAVSAMTVATVKVGDIYDEFNYGIFNPQAIRDFLSYALNNWANGLPPDYVLLLGGTSYDYRGVSAPPLNRANFVPTQIIDTVLLAQVPTDNWFVQASDSDVTPLMFIGRLPAQDSGQAAIMVDKIIDYEQNLPDPSWNTEALFVADDEPQFETFSQELIDRLPAGYTDNKVYLLTNPPPDPTGAIVNHINNGCLLVNYAGHGSSIRWAAEDIFNTSTISTLSNNNKLPVVTLGNCLNGYFVGEKTSMAEKFLQVGNKGAVAVWAPTGLGYTSGHRPLIGAFYDEIFTNGNLDLGIATTLAKNTVSGLNSQWDEMAETFVLFGDPAMELGVPTDPYVINTTPAAWAEFVPVDQNIDITFSKPISPPTISLSGPGTVGSVFTPTLNSGNRVVSYEHTDFTVGDTLIFTIDAQDTLGNALAAGPVPTTWSFTVGVGRVYLPITIRDK